MEQDKLVKLDKLDKLDNLVKVDKVDTQVKVEHQEPEELVEPQEEQEVPQEELVDQVVPQEEVLQVELAEPQEVVPQEVVPQDVFQELLTLIQQLHQLQFLTIQEEDTPNPTYQLVEIQTLLTQPQSELVTIKPHQLQETEIQSLLMMLPLELLQKDIKMPLKVLPIF